jgi:hypothetical protein
MDSNSSGILGAVGIAVSVLTAVVGIINHKRVRSSCCGKSGEVSLDIESTTPPTVKNPPPV